MTTTAKRTSANKSGTIVLYVHYNFLAVLCKTTRRNDQLLSIVENVNNGGLFFVFFFRN